MKWVDDMKLQNILKHRKKMQSYQNYNPKNLSDMRKFKFYMSHKSE